MPSVFHCPDCLLTFNTGIEGVGDFRQFAFCGSCGTTHVVHFSLVSENFVISRISYDKDGPRFISNDHLGQRDDGVVDLTFHGPVAVFMPSSSTLANREFESHDDMCDHLNCMLCGSSDVRISVSDKCACPNCQRDDLENVGGWM